MLLLSRNIKFKIFYLSLAYIFRNDETKEIPVVFFLEVVLVI